MDFRVGIDIEEVKRFKEKPFEENEAFYKRIFTENEINYCKQKYDPYIHFTGRFAAKEAVIKAVVNGTRIALSNIRINSNSDGSPSVEIVSDKVDKNCDIKISISHTENYAAAIAIAIHR